MPATDVLKKVPKWAWYASGGVAIGSAAIYAVQNRGKVPGGEGEGEGEGGEGGGEGGEGGLVETGGYQMWEPSPVPGIVVPPVITGGGEQAGAVGFAGLHETYLSSITGVMDTVTNLFVGAQTQQSNMLTEFQQTQSTWLENSQRNENEQNKSLFEYFMGGGAPINQAPVGAVAAPPAQVQTPTPPPPAPAPAAAPGPAPCPPTHPNRSDRGCYLKRGHNQTRRSGSNVWCSRIHEHVYQNGQVIVASVDKLKNGPC